jgi:hypothetical protein
VKRAALGTVVALAAAVALPVGHVLAGAAALPADRLHIGLANGPSDIGWMTSSGVPWRYRYQYLSAGVNTGHGWETWNSPPGQFAAGYMSASTSGGASYIPVFTYYELLQSQPATGSTESDKDFSNLNNTATMSSYYSNFTLLMTLANTYGKTVVVHVEPDFWAYMQQKAAANGWASAAQVPASVASSQNADLLGYDNSLQGFACGLMHLRDKYDANRNVLLAIHASLWSSGQDVGSSTDANLNAVAQADLTAAFLNSACMSANKYGGSTWDLVFNDIDDHDAGWWEQQGATNQWFTHWWDPANQAFPNFARYVAWVSELHAKTGRYQVAWQVPVGNQYFLTMNNTCGHYQDNVAPYILAHPGDFYAAGMIAVLFGAGNACQTTYTDGAGDGVTNNGGAPTTDVAGYCSACNTHVSVWPDDDGGFLRIFVAQYYLARTPALQSSSHPLPPRSPAEQTPSSPSPTRVSRRLQRLVGHRFRL